MVPHNNELHRIGRWCRIGYGIKPVLWCLELDFSCREFGKHFCNIWVLFEPAHIRVAAEASPVGQEHEGGNWTCALEGGMHCVAHEFKHYFIIMGWMAEGEASVAH